MPRRREISERREPFEGREVRRGNMAAKYGGVHVECDGENVAPFPLHESLRGERAGGSVAAEDEFRCCSVLEAAGAKKW